MFKQHFASHLNCCSCLEPCALAQDGNAGLVRRGLPYRVAFCSQDLASIKPRVPRPGCAR